MPALDLRTVLLTVTLFTLVMGLVQFYFYRVHRQRVAGLGWLTAAPLLSSVATIVFSLRGIWSDWLTVVGANAVLLFAWAAWYWGIQQFYGQRPSYGRWLSLIVLWPGLVLGGALAIELAFEWRGALNVAMYGTVMLVMARLLWSHRANSFSVVYLISVLVVMAGLTYFRTGQYFFVKNIDIFDTSILNSVWLVSFASLMWLMSLGLLMLLAERLRAEAEYASMHDSLTEVYIRRAWMEKSGQELARCQRHGRHMAMLMLDLDHFRAINQSLGHVRADAVVLDLVARTRALLGPGDVLGRLGGEEFVVLMPETLPPAALELAERIRREIEQPSPGLPPYTVSIGISFNLPTDTDPFHILSRADLAIYRAKQRGRNRVVMGED
ncbi:MAG: GGDEF domain-containing protein [Burkholderiaceae bacterium]